MHRIIARDVQQFTTMPLWEVLFAPSICQKRVAQVLSRIDARFGSLLSRSIHFADRYLLRFAAHIHPTSLFEPEEDTLALIAFGAPIHLVMAFPRCKSLWDLGAFEDRFDGLSQERIVEAYRGLLQRHLYAFGRGRRIVSKNPWFSSWTRPLETVFPDAAFIGLVRDPAETVSSQLSSVQGSLATMGYRSNDPDIVKRFVNLHQHYHSAIGRLMSQTQTSQSVIVSYYKLTTAPACEVQSAYEQLGLVLTDRFHDQLRESDRQARAYRSSHQHRLSDFGLTEQDIREQFSDMTPEESRPHVATAHSRARVRGSHHANTEC